MRPYIGVTGFMAHHEAEAAIMAYRDAWTSMCVYENEFDPPYKFQPTHDLMIGVLASAKTLDGQANRSPLRYPKREDIAGIFPVHRTGTEGAERHLCGSPKEAAEQFGIMRLVHVAPGEENVGACLTHALERGGPNCDGLQINAAWPDLGAIRELASRQPKPRIVLQIGPKAMEEVGWSPQSIERPTKLLRRVVPYAELGVTDVLIDWSAGRGVSLDGPFPLRMNDMDKPEGPLWDLYVDLGVRLGIDHPSIGVGFAGGLSAETLEPMAPLLRLGFQCSIDVEGRVRDDAPGGGNLDIGEKRPNKVCSYLFAAVNMVGIEHQRLMKGAVEG